MRKSLRSKITGIMLFIFMPTVSASAQLPGDINTPIILPSTSSSFNQNGFNLPSQPSASGQDMVRGSGGITCQSAIASGGPKFDMGMISSNDIFDRESLSFYGRLSVPMGKRPKRIDCSKLYDLEISRLKMELQLLRAGAMPGMLDQRAARSVVIQQPSSADEKIKAPAEDEAIPSQ